MPAKKTESTQPNFLLLFGTVDIEMAKNAVAWIYLQNVLKEHDALTLVINSEGGDIASAFSIIDAMESSVIPISTIGTGEIISSGIMIFMAGAQGHRYVTNNTSIMSHRFSAGTSGKFHDLQSANKEYINIHNRIIDHYMKHTGLSKSKIEKGLLPLEDVFLTAEEAVAFKIADIIVK